MSISENEKEDGKCISMEAPDEIILMWLQYMDISSITRLSLVSKRFYAICQDQQFWMALCFKNPLVVAFIESVGLDAVLKSGELSAKQLFVAVTRQNSSLLQSMLMPYKWINLTQASYEVTNTGQINSLFFKPPQGFNHKLFLNEEIAKQRLHNNSSIKKYNKVRVDMAHIDFKKLCQGGMIVYDHAIDAIVHHKSM